MCPPNPFHPVRMFSLFVRQVKRESNPHLNGDLSYIEFVPISVRFQTFVRCRPPNEITNSGVLVAP
ncbi:hypothetical protein EMIT0P44_60184 [Pseudomonas sp. IT-P44]